MILTVKDIITGNVLPVLISQNKANLIKSPAVIWKCDTGSVKKNSAAGGKCKNCPNHK